MMIGGGMNKIVFEILLIVIFIYECFYVDLKYDADYRVLYSLFSPRFFRLVFSQQQTPELNDVCARLGTCKEAARFYFPNCHCDANCREYNDCCFDATFNDTLNQVRLQHDIQYLNCETEVFRDQFYGIWLVSECPVQYGYTEISNKCRLAENIHPVSADDGTIFRNVYCAYCHNVLQYKAWQFEYHYAGKCHADKMELMNLNIPDKMRFIIENCDYLFVSPSNSKNRSCLKHVVRNVTDNPICSKFQSPVLIDKRLYRNGYCYNGSLSKEDAFCIPPNENSFGQKDYGSITLTGLFNIRPMFELFGQKTCQDNYQYDITKDACIPKNCGEDELENCDAELIRNYEWGMPLKFVTDNRIDRGFHLRLASFIHLSLPIEEYKIVITHLRGRYRCQINERENGSCCVSTTYIFFTNGKEMTSEETNRFKSDVDDLEWAYTENKNGTITSAFDMIQDTNHTRACHVTEASFKSITGYILELSSTESRFVVSDTLTSSKQIPKRIEGMVVVSEGSGFDQQVIRVEKWNLQFATTNDKHTSLQTFDADNYWSVGTLLTYSTMGVSCCSLIVTISLYSYFGLLRSTSGVISKCMLVTMFAAQLFFIAGTGATYVQTVCTTIGIISHYLWLTSFTWVSMFLFSVFRMMRTAYSCPGLIDQDQTLSRLTYCFGFSLPFLIVLPCAFLDIFSEFKIGYSDGGICFPTGAMANLFSFTIPVFISLCTNIVLLIVTSVSISRFNNTILRFQSVRKVRSFIPIYLRLSILCACPYVIGIVADILQIDYLSYIYIVLAGSNGTFVSLSFLLAKSFRRQVICNRSTTSTSGVMATAGKSF